MPLVPTRSWPWPPSIKVYFNIGNVCFAVGVLHPFHECYVQLVVVFLRPILITQVSMTKCCPNLMFHVVFLMNTDMFGLEDGSVTATFEVRDIYYMPCVFA